MTPLALGIVSDEVDPDFGAAAQHAPTWDITRFEIRCLRSGRVPAVDPAEVREVAARVRDGSVTITALSPGTFKHPLSRAREIEEELGSVLPRTIAMARELGAGMIITFGFQREEGESEDNRGKAVAYLRRAADLAAKEGMDSPSRTNRASGAAPARKRARSSARSGPRRSAPTGIRATRTGPTSARTRTAMRPSRTSS